MAKRSPAGIFEVVVDAVPDREAWQDRLMQLGNAVPKDMVRWHGELLAYGWLEQNSGFVSPGSVANT